MSSRDCTRPRMPSAPSLSAPTCRGRKGQAKTEGDEPSGPTCLTTCGAAPLGARISLEQAFRPSPPSPALAGEDEARPAKTKPASRSRSLRSRGSHSRTLRRLCAHARLWPRGGAAARAAEPCCNAFRTQNASCHPWRLSPGTKSSRKWPIIENVLARSRDHTAHNSPGREDGMLPAIKPEAAHPCKHSRRTTAPRQRAPST